jgi:hypothetical protein
MWSKKEGDKNVSATLYFGQKVMEEMWPPHGEEKKSLKMFWLSQD